MERTKAELAGIFDFLPDPTFVIDTQGTLIAWNRAMEEMTGVPASAVLGKGDYEYAVPFYGERRPLLANLVLMPGEEVERRYDTVVRTGDTLVVDVYVPTLGAGGTYLWAKASPLYDSAGNITGAIETVRDITERRLAEQRLARANAELQIAAEIQQSFLPGTIPRIEGYDIAARSVMAKEVGGDFFDVIPFEVMSLEKGTFGLMIADVSGKGIPAALFMALSRIVVRVNALWHRDPASTIRHSNNFITQDSKTGMFVTLFYGILSEKDRTLTYVNAGQNPPFLYRHRDGSIEELKPTGIFLGGFEDREYGAVTTGIGPGDIAVLFTDGVTEANNVAGEMFGEERLKALIRRHVELPAAGILEKIIAEVGSFAVDMPQFDDITIMVIKGAGQ
jgi:sigma-B regulation protein RsbU (phosphoserine phosphatase)